jgi:hypothetical protein
MSLVVINLIFGLINGYFGYSQSSPPHYLIGALCLAIGLSGLKTL